MSAAAAGVLAAIDCGTNSTRLLIVGPDGSALERRMTITRLGAGVDRTHALAGDAVERTAEVLRTYRKLMDDHGVVAARMTATSAVRDATNRDLFFGAARRAVGIDAELIGGDEEGRLSFAGATAELDRTGAPWLVADIGGGSTELAVGPAGQPGLDPVAVRSLEMGCVRLTERFLLHDPPKPTELDTARQWVQDRLDEAIAAEPAFASGRTLVGLAGTVSAAASLDQALPEYDRARLHHYRLDAGRVAVLLADLAAEPAAARRRRPGMEAARADIIVGGLVVLDGLLRRFGMSECLHSESDILDGLVMSLRAGR